MLFHKMDTVVAEAFMVRLLGFEPVIASLEDVNY